MIMKYQYMQQKVGHSSDKWFNLPWKKFERESYRLQRRIYEASKSNNMGKVKGLQKLMFHTYQARMIAIRKVTQLNNKKRIAGVDGKATLTHYERFKHEQHLKNNAHKWLHQGLKDIQIPSSEKKQR